MSREYRFIQVDVFTDRIFGGNPLAVFLDGAGLGDGEMQAIAREMNLSETTFLLPPTRSACVARVRIFTPASELAFAGHPTLGTAWAMAHLRLLPPGGTRFSLEEGIGPVPVELEGEPTSPRVVWMGHRDATFGPEITAGAVMARVLGLDESDLLPGAPIQIGSTGLGFLFVPLRHRDAVDRAVLDVTTLLASIGAAKDAGLFVFAPDAKSPADHVYSRMFAPHLGIPEDPATGSASGPLGAYLVRHGLVEASGIVHIVSEQGTKMGRQSFVQIALRADGGEAREIRVGGGVVPVLEGCLRLP
ncbi:MAG: PhzF family phenazine biosynthesis protein [Candidatus Rokubacteria bacterium]|nr:PhzF family phenazine biosynthesis protein [Candidatus Rokubacteria bacterium]